MGNDGATPNYLLPQRWEAFSPRGTGHSLSDLDVDRMDDLSIMDAAAHAYDVPMALSEMLLPGVPEMHISSSSSHARHAR